MVGGKVLSFKFKCLRYKPIFNDTVLYCREWISTEGHNYTGWIKARIQQKNKLNEEKQTQKVTSTESLYTSIWNKEYTSGHN